MRYLDIKLVEADRDKRKPVRDAGQQILDKYEDEDISDLFVSYTVIEKIGINPRSGYSTPLGVYCYPMKRVLKGIKNGGISNVEYMGDAPFVNVIRATRPEAELDLSDYFEDDLARDTAKLRAYFVDQKSIFTPAEYDQLVERSKNSDYGQYAGKPQQMIWTLTRDLSLETAEKEKNKKSNSVTEELSMNIQEDILVEWSDSSTSRSVVIWNGIFRNILGYDVAADRDGMGIIHPAEPTQAVFFSKQGFELIERIKNTSSNELSYKINLAKKVQNKTRQKFEIEKLIVQYLNAPGFYALENEMYLVSDPGVQKRIINKDLKYVNKLDITDPGVQKFVKERTIKALSGGDKNSNAINQINNRSSFDMYLRKIGISGEDKEIEQALIKGLENSSGKMNSTIGNLVKQYVTEIKTRRWPEVESYFKASRNLWNTYTDRFPVDDVGPMYFVQDYVWLKGNQIGYIEDVKDDWLLIRNMETDKTFYIQNTSKDIAELTTKKKLEFASDLPYSARDIVMVTRPDDNSEPYKGIVTKIEIPYVKISYIPKWGYYPTTKVEVYNRVEFEDHGLKEGDVVTYGDEKYKVIQVKNDTATLIDQNGYKSEKYLVSLTKSDDSDFNPSEKEPINTGAAVKILTGVYKDKIGTVTYKYKNNKESDVALDNGLEMTYLNKDLEVVKGIKYDYSEGDKVVIQTGKFAGKVGTVSYVYDSGKIEVGKIDGKTGSGWVDLLPLDVKPYEDPDAVDKEFEPLEDVPELEVGDYVIVPDGSYKGQTARVDYIYGDKSVELVNSIGNYIGTWDASKLKKASKPVTQPSYKKGDKIIMTAGFYNGDKGEIDYVHNDPDGDNVFYDIELNDGNLLQSIKPENFKKLETSSEEPLKFKVGDKVIMTAGFYEGEKGEVTYVYDSEYYDIELVDGNLLTTVKPNVFKKLEATKEPLKFKVGDKISQKAGGHVYTVTKIEKSLINDKTLVYLKWIEDGEEKDISVYPAVIKDYVVVTDTNAKNLSNVDQGKIKELINIGKQKGYVTYSQLDKLLPASSTTSEQIEHIISLLDGEGIQVVDDNAGTPSTKNNFEDDLIDLDSIDWEEDDFHQAPKTEQSSNPTINKYNEILKSYVKPDWTPELLAMIEKGKQNGFLTYSDLNATMPSHFSDSEFNALMYLIGKLKIDLKVSKDFN